MELLAQGRMAEVFDYGDGKVVKLDRPEWNGVSEFESDVIRRVSAAGLPAACTHGVVTIDGRCGVVLDRVEGRPLSEEIERSDADTVVGLAERFAALQWSINTTAVEGLPDLVSRLGGELAQSGLAPGLIGELTDQLGRLDDGSRGVCHFDFHPLNVLVGPREWVVIDWLGAATGPPLADLARTLVLWGQREDPPYPVFMGAVRRFGLMAQGADDRACDAWVRVLAGARLAEGFEGELAAWLRRVAAGDVRLCA